MPARDILSNTPAPLSSLTLIAASVWMPLVMVARPKGELPTSLPRPDTMPCVSVWSRPKGLPIASTRCPTCANAQPHGRKARSQATAGLRRHRTRRQAHSALAARLRWAPAASGGKCKRREVSSRSLGPPFQRRGRRLGAPGGWRSSPRISGSPPEESKRGRTRRLEEQPTHLRFPSRGKQAWAHQEVGGAAHASQVPLPRKASVGAPGGWRSSPRISGSPPEESKRGRTRRLEEQPSCTGRSAALCSGGRSSLSTAMSFSRSLPITCATSRRARVCLS